MNNGKFSHDLSAVASAKVEGTKTRRNDLLEQHFDTAFAAPDGIKKLRELILTLAMQGKLVEQDPNAPPASELLKEIEAEKQQLIKEKKIKKPKKLPPIKPEEIPYELPQGWEWVRFGSIALHNAGKTLDKSRNSGEPRDYITTSNLYWGRFEIDNVRQMLIRDDELEKCTATLDDLLICEGGEAGRAAVWSFDYDICFQNHVHRAHFFGYVDPFYAYRFFEKLNFTGEIDRYRKGVGISNMSGKALGSIVFPLPPLPEQHRIVACIDQLMARCDALEKLRKEREEKRLAAHSAAIKQLLDPTLRALPLPAVVADPTDRPLPSAVAPSREKNLRAFVPSTFAEATADKSCETSSLFAFLAQHFDEFYTVKENVAELRKAILQLAVMGRLVEQDPNDPPASELLQQIDTEKQRLIKEKKIKKPKKLPPIKPEEIPYQLPQSWEWVRVADVSESISYGTSKKTCDDLSLIPVYRMGNIVDGQLIDKGFKYVSPDIDDLPRLYLQPNDILFNRTNSYELVGKSALYSGPEKHATYASYLIGVRLCNSLLNPFYITATMNAPYFRKTQIEPEIVQQCGQANFNGTKLSLCKIPLPPLPEQHRIVDRIDQLMALCDTLEQQIDAATHKQTELLNAVMSAV